MVPALLHRARDAKRTPVNICGRRSAAASNLKRAIALAANLSVMALGACVAASRAPRSDASAPSHATPQRAGSALGAAASADCSNGHACSCGNGTVEANEECDYADPEWADICDDRCRRTVYEACSNSEQCFGANARCAAYAAGATESFCAEFCEHDADCLSLPGFTAVCNLAWCIVLCDDGKCPNGMMCIADQAVLDRAGDDAGRFDVCVAEKH